jgi:hypothetical protein
MIHHVANAMEDATMTRLVAVLAMLAGVGCGNAGWGNMTAEERMCDCACGGTVTLTGSDNVGLVEVCCACPGPPGSERVTCVRRGWGVCWIGPT